MIGKANHQNYSGVINSLSCKGCEMLSEKLMKLLLEKGVRNVSVSFYHAGAKIHERQKIS